MKAMKAMKSKALLVLLTIAFASPALAVVNEGTIDCRVKDDGPYKRIEIGLGELAGDCTDFEQGIYGSAIKMYPDGGSDFGFFDSACISSVQPERGDFRNTRKIDAKLANDRDVKVSLMLSPKNDQKLVVLNTKTASAEIIRVQCKLKPSI